LNQARRCSRAKIIETTYGTGRLLLTGAAANEKINITAKARGSDIVSNKLEISVIAEKAPDTITVNPTTPSVSIGGKQQFSITVPQYDSETVEWSIDPTTAGSISATGELTVNDKATLVGTTITVTAKSTVDSTKTATTTVTVEDKAVKISVTGIDAKYNKGEIQLHKNGTAVASGSGSITGGTLATITLMQHQDTKKEFATAGAYEVILELSHDTTKISEILSISAKDLKLRTNQIQRTEFSAMAPRMTVTVTGIPPVSKGQTATISLYKPTGKFAKEDLLESRSVSTSNNTAGNIPFYYSNLGTYDLMLELAAGATSKPEYVYVQKNTSLKKTNNIFFFLLGKI